MLKSKQIYAKRRVNNREQALKIRFVRKKRVKYLPESQKDVLLHPQFGV